MRSSRKLDAADHRSCCFCCPCCGSGRRRLAARLYSRPTTCTFEPWAELGRQFGAGMPQNPLISDLVLENYQWKSLMRDAVQDRAGPALEPAPLRRGAVPGGRPALSPVSSEHRLLYPAALAGLRGLHLAAARDWPRPACMSLPACWANAGRRRFLAAVAYSFSGFFISQRQLHHDHRGSRLAATDPGHDRAGVRMRSGEKAPASGTARARPAGRHRRWPSSSNPICGRAARLLFGLQALAGHVEITYYVLMVSAFYAAVAPGRRLAAPAGAWLSPPRARWARNAGRSRLAAGDGFLGMALGGVQLLPLYELADAELPARARPTCSRSSTGPGPKARSSPSSCPTSSAIPPTTATSTSGRRHWEPVTLNALGQAAEGYHQRGIDWGVKNYVEGANYLGLMTLLLALVAAAGRGAGAWARRAAETG